jgi:hypothetical protein
MQSLSVCIPLIARRGCEIQLMCSLRFVIQKMVVCARWSECPSAAEAWSMPGKWGHYKRGWQKRRVMGMHQKPYIRRILPVKLLDKGHIVYVTGHFGR